ncbi:MAG: heterodisulfide reductase subunit B, partial [Acidithiobacillus sp.]
MSENTQQGVSGHGAFFQDTNLSAQEAETATAWVRSHVDRRSVDLGERMDDIRDHMWQLEKE